MDPTDQALNNGSPSLPRLLAPKPAHRRTGRRLAKAPADVLAAAAAQVLGAGNRTALLLAAAAGTSTAGLQPERAINGLLQEHKERLLDAVNLSLIATGRLPV